MSERFSRQSFLGDRFDETLASCRICVVGLGGGGSHVVQQLVHLGAADVVVFDEDQVEESNLNRLAGATYEDAQLELRKVDVAARVARSVNPDCKIKPVPERWQERAKLLRGCDVVFGCVDSYRSRYELEITCRRYLIPYIDIGMEVRTATDGYLISGQVILSLPDWPCMRCLGFITEADLAREAEHYGAGGARPQVVWPNAILASSAIGIFVQLFGNWSSSKPPLCLNYDGNRHLLFEDSRVAHLSGVACSHLKDVEGLGDPLWIPEG